MTEITSRAPPPYATESQPFEATLPSSSSLTLLSDNNMEGLRASIMDNIPVLFTLSHRGDAKMPQEFRLVTVRLPSNPAATATAGLIHATVVYMDSTYTRRPEPRPFVQGPPRETTVEALQALLQKTEEMLGRRWAARVHSPQVGKILYLES